MGPMRHLHLAPPVASHARSDQNIHQGTLPTKHSVHYIPHHYQKLKVMLTMFPEEPRIPDSASGRQQMFV